ncbi:hypothetical protein [Hymenobacter defluvii]|uniref:Terminase small subunit protein n=1 Tax=Hymenobacter defluvii TaxID=2054411 RepID=A0ABS3THS9_9BACT|nr:hypothetical protein [Hymenobacter defluvii]MBO3273214.1 hypothetical protein [Hymenobacter defluvii]
MDTPNSSTPTGRPSTYSLALAETLCAYLVDGKTLRWICEQPGMPAKGTILRWARDNASFRDQYTLAREIGDELLAEELLEIADDGTNDYMTITKGDATYNVENREVTNRSRMRIDARKWLLSKRLPKKYGDKVDVTSGGEKISSGPRVFQILPASQRPPADEPEEADEEPTV